MNRNKDIELFFKAKSIAILGASRSPVKFGNVFLRAYQFSGFEGKIFPINPYANEINGIKAYPNIEAVPEKVDLAIISTSPDEVLDLVRQIVKKGTKCIIIFSAGFGELGEEGKKKEQELLKIIRGKASIIGPNCIGIYVPSNKLSFFPGIPVVEGPISFISQSGFLCATVARWGVLRGLGYSKVVSLGNSVDLTITDFLEYLENDPDTKIISLYIEGIKQKDGRRFLELVRRISKKKPILIWKTGKTKLGQQVVSSHTGSIGGNKEIWESIIKENRLVPVRSVEELLDYYQTFLEIERFRKYGKNICLIASQGGLISNTSDLFEENNFQIASLSENTLSKLKKMIPKFGTNVAQKMPIDISIAAALDVNLYIQVTKAVIDDPNVDIIMILGSMEITNEFGNALLKLRKKSDKPIILVQPVIPLRFSKMELKLRQNGILVFYTMVNAVKSLKYLFDYIDYINL